MQRTHYRSDEMVDDPAHLDAALEAVDDNCWALATAAHALILEKRYRDALRIYDAIVTPALGLEHLCNALWVVQSDNTGLPLDAARAHRYLACALPEADRNPPIHLNAAGVYMELEDPQAAMLHLLLARQLGVDLAPHLDDELLQPLADHPRWCELRDGIASPVSSPSMLELASQAFSAGEIAHAIPALLRQWHDTRAPQIADLLDEMSRLSGDRHHYRGGWLESTLRDRAPQLAARIGTCGVTLRDGSGGYSQKGDPMHRLASDFDDPRYATAVLGLLQSPPETEVNKSVEDGWRVVVDNLVALGDRRIIGALNTLSVNYAARMPTVIGEWLGSYLGAAARALSEQSVPTELNSSDTALCAEMAAAMADRLPAAAAAVTAEAAEADRAGSPESALDGARMSLLDGALEPAIVQLLDAWTRTRAPRIAELLDRATERRDAASSGDKPATADFDFICADASESADKLWWAKKHKDPRVISALARMLDNPPFIVSREDDNGVERFWDEVMQTCIDLEDSRIVAPLQRLSQRATTLAREADLEARAEMYVKKPIGPYLAYQLNRVAETVQARGVPALSSQAAGLCTELEQLFQPERDATELRRTEAEDLAQAERLLLEAIAAEPDNDGPRHAYANWLADRDMNRWEFIKLQLLEAGGQPAAEWEADVLQRASLPDLLEEGETAWLGELSPVVKRVRYHRGFPDAIELGSDCLHELDARRIDDIGWSTVTHLKLDSSPIDTEVEPELLALVQSPRMGALRELCGAGAGLVIALARDHDPGYRTLGVEVSYLREAGQSALVSALECYRSLEIVNLQTHESVPISTITRVLASPLAQRVECLAISVHHGAPDSSAVYERACRSDVRRLELSWGYGRLEQQPGTLNPSARYQLSFTRDAAGELSVLTATSLHRGRTYSMSPIIESLYQLPAAALTSFTLAPMPGTSVKPRVDALDALRAALRRFPRLELPVLLESQQAPAELIGELLEELASTNESTANQAAKKLGELRTPLARTALAEQVIVGGRDGFWGREALEALVPIMDDTIIPTLRAALAIDDTPLVWDAITMLGCLRSREAVAELLELLASRQYDLAVLEALARIGSAEAIPAVLSYLATPKLERRNRRIAIDTLGMLGASEARDAIIEFLIDGDVYDKDCAATALGLIGVPSDRELLNQHIDATAPRRRGRILLARALLVPEGVSQDWVGEFSTQLEAWIAYGSEDALAKSVLELAGRAPRCALWIEIGAAIIVQSERELRSIRTRLLDESHLRLIARAKLLQEIAEAWRRHGPPSDADALTSP